jgi:hypothetical protein
MVAILQIVRSEHMAAEGEPVAERSKKQIFGSLPVPVPPKKMKGSEECVEMLKKAFTILMSSAKATASTDDECRSFGSFISNKL